MAIFNFQSIRIRIILILLLFFYLLYFVEWHDKNVEKCADATFIGSHLLYEWKDKKKAPKCYYNEKNVEFLLKSFKDKRELRAYESEVRICQEDKEYAPNAFDKKWDDIKIINKEAIEEYINKNKCVKGKRIDAARRHRESLNSAWDKAHRDKHKKKGKKDKVEGSN